MTGQNNAMKSSGWNMCPLRGKWLAAISTLLCLLVLPSCDPDQSGNSGNIEDIYPHTRSTNHFSIQYIETAADKAALMDTVAESMEHSWNVLIGNLGYPEPRWVSDGSINVFLGDGHPDTPDGTSGVYFDSQGRPLIIFGTGWLVADEDRGWMHIQAACPHEFFHVVQFQTEGYDFLKFGPYKTIEWLVEGSANWAKCKVFPDFLSDKAANHYAYYIMSPHLALSFFHGWEGIGNTTNPDQFFSVRIYGTWVFDYYLTDVVFDDSVIKNLWIQGAGQTDPLKVLENLSQSRGVDIRDVFADFAAWTLTLENCFHKNDLTTQVEEFARKYDQLDFRITASHASGGTDWTGVARDLLPEHHAFNVIELKSPARGRLHIGFMGEASGTLGTPSSFRLRLVKVYGEQGNHKTIEIPVAKGFAESEIEVGGETACYLVVVTWDGDPATREVFPYSYKMTINSNNGLAKESTNE